MTNLNELFSGSPSTGQQLRLLHVEDQKSSGTEGGTCTLGSWQTRVLNTVVTNEISGASLSTNQITLPAGTYVYEIKAPGHRIDHHKAKLYNITDSVDIHIGTVEQSNNAAHTSNISRITGKVSLTKTTIIEVQHRSQSTQATEGFGSANASLTGVEVYSVVKIWQILDSRALPQQAELFHVEDQKASGTNGGTFTAGSWQTRVLNTEVTSQIENASLAANQITLPAGRYLIEASAPAINVNRHKAKLYNITDATDLLIGSSEYSHTSSPVTSKSIIAGEFSIGSTKTLELQHQCGATLALTGFGEKSTFGVIELYSIVKIWKIG